jgi:thioredoxin-like negative regulator of GroEL
MMKFISIIATLLSLQTVSALFEPGNESVEVLTEDNFKATVLESKQPWFIKFYAPWCPHCQRLVADWEKIGHATKDVVRVGAVDCTVNV